jgi:hypothetical protein
MHHGSNRANPSALRPFHFSSNLVQHQVLTMAEPLIAFLDRPSSVSFIRPTWRSQDLSCFSRGHREVPIQYLCNMSQQLAAAKASASLLHSFK